MYKIAIDLGYGYVKGVNETGKTVLIRTAVGTGVNRQLSSYFGANEKGNREHVIISQGEVQKQYYIGNLARKEARDCSSPFEKNKIDNPSTKVLLAVAFAVLNKDNKHKEQVHIVTGPPLLYVAEQKESFRKALMEYNAVLQFAGEEKFYVIKFDKVTIFPQGAAVVYHLLKKHPELAHPGKTFAIIELGYKTTEILMFEITHDKKIQPISGYSTTLELGMNFVEKAIDEIFFQKTGSKLIPSAIDKVMNGTPEITYGGTTINLEEARNNAKDEMVRNILDGITQTLGEQIGFVDKIIFAGGVIQDEYISKRVRNVLTKNVLIMDDGQFANAYGMLEVARAVEAKEAREAGV